MNEYKLLLVPGDGIGPEVLDATMRVVGWYGHKGLPYQTEEALLGGAAIDATGRPDPDETFVKALAADAVLMGSVGGPKWDGLPFAQRAERGLLRLRKDMGVSWGAWGQSFASPRAKMEATKLSTSVLHVSQ